VATAYASIKALRQLLDAKAAELGPAPMCPHVPSADVGQDGVADVLAGI
jgi:hypothetical protein